MTFDCQDHHDYDQSLIVFRIIIISIKIKHRRVIINFQGSATFVILIIVIVMTFKIMIMIMIRGMSIKMMMMMMMIQGSVSAATKILPNDSSSLPWGTLLWLWLQGADIWYLLLIFVLICYWYLYFLLIFVICFWWHWQCLCGHSKDTSLTLTARWCQWLKCSFMLTLTSDNGDAVDFDGGAGDRLSEPSWQRLHHTQLHQPDKVSGSISDFDFHWFLVIFRTERERAFQSQAEARESYHRQYPEGRSKSYDWLSSWWKYSW